MFVRRSTRVWLVTLGLMVLMGTVGTVLYYLPAQPSSAIGRVDIALPKTTEVIIDGTPVAQFPPPPGVVDTRPAASSAPASAVITATAVVTFSTEVLPRPQFAAPTGPALATELGFTKDEIAQLDPRYSEWRTFAPGEQPEVAVTADTRALAQAFLAPLNELRAEQGLPALIWDEDLAARAEGHAQTMLYYWVQGNGLRVLASHREQVNAYYGLGPTPRYPRIGFDSLGAPTALLEEPDAASVRAMLLPEGADVSPYGAAVQPVVRVGIGIAIPTTGTASLPQGWLTMAFQ